MNIKFKRLELQNFKSIGKLTVIDFERLTGLNYIYGTNLDSPSSRNGSGKTTLMDGLVFALYGRTIKNIGNQYIANRYCDKKLKTYTKIYFEVDGVNYTSECFCKPYIKAVGMTLQKYDNEKQEWVDLTQSSVIKTKQYIIDNILNCTFELFKSAIIISASDCLNFYQGMTKQQKRNYIENIFNLNCFGVMFNLIKSDLNDLKKQITYNNNQIIKSTNQLQQLQLKFDSFNEQINKNISQIKNQLINNCNKVKQLTEQKLKLQESIKQYQNESIQYKTICKDIKTLNNAKIVLEKDIIKYQSKINAISGLIDQISKIKQGLCQTCTELVNTKYNYNDKVKQIDVLNNNVIQTNNKIQKLNTSITQYEKKSQAIQSNIDQYNKIQTTINSLQININHIKEQIKRLKKDYDNLTNEQSNPFGDLIKKTQEELTNTKQRTKNYYLNIKHLDILKQACSQNGVKSFIIKDIVKLLNSLIQKYLNEIGAEYLVYFDESFDFKFITMTGECEYCNFSAGERQRIQIATVFAFRDLIINGKINANIFMIDQFLDSAIDSICIKNVLQILYKKTIEHNLNIFIISHRQETTEKHIFSNVIEVIKENGISTVKIN